VPTELITRQCSKKVTRNGSHRQRNGEKTRTPAINKPNATPNSPQLFTAKEVWAGVQRLPGGSVFESPSITITTIMSTVDIIPRRDAYDKSDKGKKTVGTNL
jgi:hypothetical protein